MASNTNIPVVCIAIANERTEHGFLRGLNNELKNLMKALQPSIRAEKVELVIMPAATANDIAVANRDSGNVSVQNP